MARSTGHFTSTSACGLLEPYPACWVPYWCSRRTRCVCCPYTSSRFLHLPLLGACMPQQQLHCIFHLLDPAPSTSHDHTTCRAPAMHAATVYHKPRLLRHLQPLHCGQMLLHPHISTSAIPPQHPDHSVNSSASCSLQSPHHCAPSRSVQPALTQPSTVLDVLRSLTPENESLQSDKPVDRVHRTRTYRP